MKDITELYVQQLFPLGLTNLAGELTTRTQRSWKEGKGEKSRNLPEHMKISTKVWLCFASRRKASEGLCKSQSHALQPFKNYFKWCSIFNMYGVSSLHCWQSVVSLFTCNSHRHSLKVFHLFLSTSLGHVPILYAAPLCRMYSSFCLNQSFNLKKATNLILSAVIASNFSDNLQAKDQDTWLPPMLRCGGEAGFSVVA